MPVDWPEAGRAASAAGDAAGERCRRIARHVRSRWQELPVPSRKRLGRYAPGYIWLIFVLARTFGVITRPEVDAATVITVFCWLTTTFIIEARDVRARRDLLENNHPASLGGGMARDAHIPADITAMLLELAERMDKAETRQAARAEALALALEYAGLPVMAGLRPERRLSAVRDLGA